MKKPKLGSGKRFEALAEKVEKSYEKKGMSKAKAEKVGGAVAAARSEEHTSELQSH